MVPPARMGGISRALTPRVNYSRGRDRMQPRFSNDRGPSPCCPCCPRGLAPCSPAACLAEPVPALVDGEPPRARPAPHAGAGLAAPCVRAGSAVAQPAASPVEAGAAASALVVAPSPAKGVAALLAS